MAQPQVPEFIAKFQSDYEAEMEKYRAIEKEMRKLTAARGRLESQLTENKHVLEEFKYVNEDSVVYKSIGPVLMKQDPEEARANVQKRVDYISGEVTTYEKSIKDNEKKQQEQAAKIQQLQVALQQISQAMAQSQQQQS
eukprot:Clim_evm13s146 gene=Clim_evmTU13s146